MNFVLEYFLQPLRKFDTSKNSFAPNFCKWKSFFCNSHQEILIKKFNYIQDKFKNSSFCQLASKILILFNKITWFVEGLQQFYSTLSTEMNWIQKKIYLWNPKYVWNATIKIFNSRKITSILLSSFLGDTVPALKAAMSIISKLPLGPTREPLEALWEGNLEKMKNELHEMGLVWRYCWTLNSYYWNYCIVS